MGAVFRRKVNQRGVISVKCEACDYKYTLYGTLTASASVTATYRKETREAPKKLTEQIERDLAQQRKLALVNLDSFKEPCPSCGYYQSWQSEADRKTGGVFLVIAAIIAVIILILFAKGTLGLAWSIGIGLCPVSLIVVGIFTLLQKTHSKNNEWLEKNNRTVSDLPEARPIEIEWSNPALTSDK